MIRIRNLTVRHGEGAPALDAITLAIAAGEMTGILGPNGSGKTTLLRAVAGSLVPTSGEVLLGEKPVSSLSHKERARRMAFVPQRPEGIPDFTVAEMVAMGRYPHRAFLAGESPADRAAVSRALAATDAVHLAERPARSLSGGEFQRILVARAFAQEADILLLDEAATGLDPAHALALFSHVRTRNRCQGLTVLTAIHDLNMAALFCDRLVFLREGKLVADGPTRATFTAAVLEEVYGAPFLVLEHPVLQLPQALALPVCPSSPLAEVAQ